MNKFMISLLYYFLSILDTTEHELKRVDTPDGYACLYICGDLRLLFFKGEIEFFIALADASGDLNHIYLPESMKAVLEGGEK